MWFVRRAARRRSSSTSRPMSKTRWPTFRRHCSSRHPAFPRGHVLMGYDEHGRCPMLRTDGCSIYEHRPRTCRTYDCRVFPAAGVLPDEPGKAPIATQAARWEFTYASSSDSAEHAAVRAAAAFLRSRHDALGTDLAPATTTQLAVAASRYTESSSTSRAFGARRASRVVESQEQPMSADVTAALAAVTGALPAAEERPGQRQMAQEAVASSIDSGRHLVVQAGTARARRSATSYQRSWQANEWSSPRQLKALQGSVGGEGPAVPWKRTLGIPFDWAVLKGRSNYVHAACAARSRGLRQRPARAGGVRRNGPRWRSTDRMVGHHRIPATRRGSTGHPAIEHGRRSASAATSAPAPPAA